MEQVDNKTILLVDDEPFIAIGTRKELEGCGYSVQIALSGEKALDAFSASQDIDLVLMDINLGSGIDGPETARRMLDCRTVPIVFYSSHTEPEIVERTEKITSYGYVVKNCGITVLNASIKMAFRLFEANREVEQQKQRLSTTLQSIGDAVITTDVEGNIKHMNPSAEALTGWDLKTAEGMPLEEVVHIVDEADRDKRIENPFTRVKREETVINRSDSSLLIAKGGKVIPIADSAGPIKDKDNNITGIVLVFQNHTEQRHSRHLMEARLSLLDYEKNHTFDELIAFALHSAEEFTYSRTAFFHLVGSHGTGSSTQIHSQSRDTSDALRKEIEKVIEECLKREIPSLCFDSGDRRVWKYQLLVTPVVRENKIVALLGAADRESEFTAKEGEICTYLADITWELVHKRHTDNALQQSENRFRELAENIREVFWVFDWNEQKVLYVSPLFEQVWGVPVDTLLADYSVWAECVHPEDKEKANASFRKIAETGGGEIREYRICRPDGSVRWIADKGFAVYDEQGAVDRIVGIAEDMTERKQTQQELLKERDYLDKVINSLPGVFYMFNMEGKMHRWNLNFEEVIGYSSIEIAHKYAFEFIAESDRQHAMDQVDEVMAHGRSRSEAAFVTKDGREIPYLLTGEKIIIDDNVFILGQGVDISDRLKAERVSAEAYEIVEKSPAVAFLWQNREGWPVEYVTENIETVFGYTSEELTSGSITYAQLVHPDDLERVVEEVAAYSSEEGRDSFVHVPYRVFTKQGEIRWVDDRTYIRRNEKGDITHFQGIIMDITEMKLAEAALFESENRFRQLAERLDDAVWLWSLTDPIQVLYGNPAFERIWGVTPDEVNRNPRNAMKNVPKEDQEKINSAFEAFHQGKHEFSLEHRVMKRDGTVRWVWARAYGVYNEDGTMFRAVGIAHDITQNKRSMEKIRSLLSEKEILLKEVHHRIKNNMNTLQSLLTLQMSRLNNRSAVAALEAAKSRMTTMMLLYEKLYQSKTIQEISAREFLIALIDEMASTYSVDVQITKDIEEVTIPASTASSLGIIVYELISNAMKYAFTNGKNNQLSISLKAVEDRISIIVEDNGRGYNPDGQKSGFGLELVSSLLESMDGTFTIETNNGTRCIMELAAR